MMMLSKTTQLCARSPRAEVLALLASLLLWAASPARVRAEPADDRREPSPSAAAASAQKPFAMLLSAGAGVGQRGVSLPTQRGVRTLETGLFPVLDVLLQMDASVGRRGLMGARFHYQTSVGMLASETPSGGVEKRSSLRANRVEAGLTPGLRFGETERSVSLRLFVGWSFRGMRSVVDTSIPSYTLHGPVFRPELRVPFANGILALRLAPEAQWIAGVTHEFQRAGSTAASGFAYAGEATLSARISPSVVATLSYRESHASLSTPWSDRVSDVERFLSAGVALCL